MWGMLMYLMQLASACVEQKQCGVGGRGAVQQMCGAHLADIALCTASSGSSSCKDSKAEQEKWRKMEARSEKKVMMKDQDRRIGQRDMELIRERLDSGRAAAGGMEKEK